MKEAIKVLIIGKRDWIGLIEKTLNNMNSHFQLETIDNEEAAINRLRHNSYNILLLQDEFSAIESVKLASLAYAMTRPSIIICSSLFKFIKLKIWHYLSRFSNIFKTSKKLINFNYNMNDLRTEILFLSSDYAKYFELVNDEIKQHTL